MNRKDLTLLENIFTITNNMNQVERYVQNESCIKGNVYCTGIQSHIMDVSLAEPAFFYSSLKPLFVTINIYCAIDDPLSP
uniref:Uncharacterized protein n=1 Tax=Strongyloides venezuelensis TaxID=75913 RepID=A0A0K0FMI4_STRVS